MAFWRWGMILEFGEIQAGGMSTSRKGPTNTQHALPCQRDRTSSTQRAYHTPRYNIKKCQKQPHPFPLPCTGRPSDHPPPPFPSNQTHLRQAPAPGPAGPLETQPLPDGGTLGSPASASRSISVTDPASRRVSPSSPSRAPVTAFRARWGGRGGGRRFLCRHFASRCIASRVEQVFIVMTSASSASSS